MVNRPVSKREAISMGLPIFRAGNEEYDSDFFRDLANKMDLHGISYVILEPTIYEDIQEHYYFIDKSKVEPE